MSGALKGPQMSDEAYHAARQLMEQPESVSTVKPSQECTGSQVLLERWGKQTSPALEMLWCNGEARMRAMGAEQQVKVA